ncbi:hypothetical protein L0222_07295 [bacterium]|nr:hypothetical protein [bacterium]MCI0602254.1 hypothetical protein [bacterium]
MRIFSISLSLFFITALALADPSAIRRVSVSPPSFNPSEGQKVEITAEVDHPGILSLMIIDRDGYPIREFDKQEVTANQKVSFTWNGFDKEGSIVANEAYSLRIALVADGKRHMYFPADSIVDMISIREAKFSRQDGILSYRLPSPSRVHLQAGIGYIDPVTKKQVDFVLRTLVNREPRPAGAIVETWDLMDESGTIRVSELKNFIVGIAATPLCENSIITYGNRNRKFLDWVSQRKGQSFFTARTDHHHHHKGLRTLDDISPTMKLNILNAAKNKLDQSWQTNRPTIQVSGEITGANAANFTKQPGFIAVFVDGKNVHEIPNPVSPFEIEIPIDKLKPGDHVVAVNWASTWGPVAANSFRLKIENKTVQSKLR